MTDKALQNSIMVLEQVQLKSRCVDLVKEKKALEHELSLHKKQVESLKDENSALSKEYSQTTSILQVTKEEKDKLENEFASVFQLYNMTDGNSLITKVCGENLGQDLKEELSSLVKNTVKLTEDLASSEQSNETLKRELDTVKVSLQRFSCIVSSTS